MEKGFKKLLLSLSMILLLVSSTEVLFAADQVIVNGEGGSVTVDNVIAWHDCEPKGAQLIDKAHNGSYITFDLKSTTTGYFTFTSAIATSLNDISCALGKVNANGVFTDSDTLAIKNRGSWTSTENYEWLFYLEADVVYNFKMMCFAGSGYALNTFSIKITPFVADVDLKKIEVNGFEAIADNGEYTTEAYSDNDLIVAFTPSASTAEVTYSAICNDAEIAISNDGVIDKSAFASGDVVKVIGTIAHGAAATANYTIIININDLLKKQIRGEEKNNGYWTNVASSSLVQMWTDYIYSVTPTESSSRFASGTWRSVDGSTQYVFYAKNANATLTIPSNFKISSISLIGYGAGTIGLSSEGATVTAVTATKFDDAATATQLDEIKFSIENHAAGTPLEFSVDDVYTRFYIVFSYEKLEDVTAPVLVNQNIEEGGEIAEINGAVSLRFNEAIKLTETAEATMNGVAAKLYLENNIFVRHYFTGLEHDSENTFVLKANSVEDLSGNTNETEITINFSVGSKAPVVKKAYDFVVGIDGTIDEAIAAANGNRTRERFYIFVPNGSYELTGNDGDHMTSLNRDRVSIIGQSKDNAIITNTPASYGISTTATIHLRSADYTYMEDITIKNNRGEDGEGQQVALYDRSNHNIFKNIKIFSFQDTYVSGGPAYWEECDIYGSTDYICGGGDVFFDNCLLYNRAASGSKITAPATDPSLKWGYVFMNCTIQGGQYVLGRPWQGEPRTYFLYTKMNRQPDGTGWEGMGGLVTHFYEYKSMDADGNLLDLSGRGNSPTSTNSYTPVLTDEEADDFTLYNVVGREDNWMPSDYTYQTNAPVLTVSGSTISWQNDDGALCAVIFKDDEFVACTAENKYKLEENGTYTVQLANEMGGLGEAASITVTTVGVKLVRDNKSMTTGAIYDIMGRRLNKEPESGLFIKDGQKYYKHYKH